MDKKCYQQSHMIANNLRIMRRLNNHKVLTSVLVSTTIPRTVSPAQGTYCQE